MQSLIVIRNARRLPEWVPHWRNKRALSGADLTLAIHTPPCPYHSPKSQKEPHTRVKLWRSYGATRAFTPSLAELLHRETTTKSFSSSLKKSSRPPSNTPTV